MAHSYRDKKVTLVEFCVQFWSLLHEHDHNFVLSNSISKKIIFFHAKPETIFNNNDMSRLRDINISSDIVTFNRCCFKIFK